MTTINSPLATGNGGVPLINSTQIGQASGLHMHFPSLSAFQTAVTNEQANVAAGSPLWADGQPMTISTENPSGTRRLWSVSLNHANTVSIANSIKVILSTGTNTVLTNSGIPGSGVGNNGDLSVDPGNAYYLKTSGAWNKLGDLLKVTLVNMTSAQLFSTTGQPGVLYVVTDGAYRGLGYLWDTVNLLFYPSGTTPTQYGLS